MNRLVVNLLRKHGFESVNVDLIYGLPYQTPESFERKESRDEVIEWLVRGLLA